MASSNISLGWLGQSGFILYALDTIIACDLYLSDFCRKKSKLDHTRLMPIPIQPKKLDFIDNYLITHSHIDHFDPETIEPVLSINSKTKFWCPPACRNVIMEYFPENSNRFVNINTGKIYKLTVNTSLIAIPAAHEGLLKSPDGEYIYLSYIILLAAERKAVFFAGDTIPFAGQIELINNNIPDNYKLTMTLPVNGRNKKRANLGFKGNMDIDEAIVLANACNAVRLIPCHYGMFALNDVSEKIDLELFDEFRGETWIPCLFNRVFI
jgi:L-ascorbate metabolism protein UlaG (beta-lactamase superfamily)